MKIFKKISALMLMLAVFGASSITAFADDYIVYHDGGNDHTVITGFSENHKDETEISIPLYFEDSPEIVITGIDAYAFANCPNVERITIPSTIEEIDPMAFYGCEKLTDIWFSGGSRTEGGYVSKDGFLLKDENSTLSMCLPGLTGDIAVPDGVKKIDEWAFFGCNQINAIYLPDSVESIEKNAFGECRSLIKLFIPDTVTEISDEAFEPGNKVAMYGFADSYAQKYAEEHDMSFTVICCSVGSGSGRAVLYIQPAGEDSVIITGGRPDGRVDLGAVKGYDVAGIGNNAFEDSLGLTAIVIPDTVKSIGDWAFKGCTQLSSPYIPASVEKIGANAFYSCESIEAFEVSEKNKSFTVVDGVLFSKDLSTIVAFPAGRGGSYTVPDSVTKIADYAFAGCSLLQSVEIPAAVTDIGIGVFNDCGNDLVLEVKPNSSAEKYARRNDLQYNADYTATIVIVLAVVLVIAAVCVAVLLLTAKNRKARKEERKERLAAQRAAMPVRQPVYMTPPVIMPQPVMTGIVCGRCGFQNVPAAKFCVRCASPLVIAQPVIMPQSPMQQPVSYPIPGVQQPGQNMPNGGAQ